MIKLLSVMHYCLSSAILNGFCSDQISMDRLIQYDTKVYYLKCNFVR